MGRRFWAQALDRRPVSFSGKDSSWPTWSPISPPDPRNARRHSPRNLDQIRASLEAVGAARSIVIDEDNVILAGNATVDAAKAAGLTHLRIVDADGDVVIAVRRSNLTPEQKQRLALADNCASDLAAWDPDVLAELSTTFDLSAFWTDDELTVLLDQAPEIAFPEFDETAADEVAYAVCPEFGHRFPR
jgi:hypothetical protein